MLGAGVLNHDFVRWYGEISLACKLFFHCFDDMVGQEWLAIILSNVSVGYKAGFAAQIACELTAVVVLDDDCVPRTLEQAEDRISM